MFVFFAKQTCRKAGEDQICILIAFVFQKYEKAQQAFCVQYWFPKSSHQKPTFCKISNLLCLLKSPISIECAKSDRLSPAWVDTGGYLLPAAYWVPSPPSVELESDPSPVNNIVSHRCRNVVSCCIVVGLIQCCQLWSDLGRVALFGTVAQFPMVPTPDRSPPPCMAPVSPSFRGVECCRVWCAAYCWSYWVSGEGHVQVRAPAFVPFSLPNQTKPCNTIPYQTPPHQAKPNSSRIYHAETSRVPIVDTTVPYRTVPHPIIPFHALSNQFSGRSPSLPLCVSHYLLHFSRRCVGNYL